MTNEKIIIASGYLIQSVQREKGRDGPPHYEKKEFVGLVNNHSGNIMLFSEEEARVIQSALTVTNRPYQQSFKLVKVDIVTEEAQ